MNKSILLGIVPLVATTVLANYGYGMMGGASGVGMGVYGIIWFAIAVFVFSLIFWYTYKLIIKKQKG